MSAKAAEDDPNQVTVDVARFGMAPVDPRAPVDPFTPPAAVLGAGFGFPATPGGVSSLELPDHGPSRDAVLASMAAPYWDASSERDRLSLLLPDDLAQRVPVSPA